MARPTVPGDLRPAAAAIDEVERLGVLFALHRWVAHTAALPERRDWERDQEWPDPQIVDDLFGSWEAMVEESGAAGSPVLGLKEELASERERVKAHARSLEEDAKKLPELRRQLDVAKRKRDEAQDEAGRAAREAQRLASELEGARARAEIATAGSAAPVPAPEPAAAAEPDAALERERSQHAADRAALLELQGRLDVVTDEHERARRTIAQLASELARASAQAPAPAAGDDAAVEATPRTALEAVEIAAREARALRFAPRAFESAADSPFTRPEQILRTLRALDELALAYADPAGMGRSLVQAAGDLGLTQYKGDVSEVTRGKYPDHYRFTFEGHELAMGPHVGLGTGSGAGHIARIYLYVGEHRELGRVVVVGWVGRHLPDSTT